MVPCWLQSLRPNQKSRAPPEPGSAAASCAMMLAQAGLWKEARLEPRPACSHVTQDMTSVSGVVCSVYLAPAFVMLTVPAGVGVEGRGGVGVEGRGGVGVEGRGGVGVEGRDGVGDGDACDGEVGGG